MRFSALALNRLLCLPTRISLLLIALAGLLQPAMATTVTYAGTTASQNLGPVIIGSSTSVILSFSVSGTIGSVEVVTQGTPNLDFTNAGGGTCTGGTTTACTVDVTFKPIYAGLRRGAVLFWSGAGNSGSIVGKTFIYGVGNGGQVVYLPPVISLVATPSNLSPNSWNSPTAVALDGTGDLYVVDGGNQRLVEIPISGAASVVGGSLSYPNKAVVDGAGDLLIADTDDGRIVEVPVGGGAAIDVNATVNGTSLQYAYAVDVDGLGNLYVVDAAQYRVIKITNITSTGTGTGSLVNLGGHSLLYGNDVWLDAAGDLFISDGGFDFNNSTDYVPTAPQVLEVQADGTVTTVTVPGGTGCAVEGPWSAEEDAAGNLFIGDEVPAGIGSDGYETFAGRMVEYPVGGGTCIITTSVLGSTLGAGGVGMGEVNLSASGDIYISDLGGNRVIKEQRSVAPTVAFSHSTTIGTLDTTDGTKTVQISNIGNQTLDFSELSYPADFAAGSASSQCTSSSTVAINGVCNVAIEFYPQNSGSLSENVILTNNANGGSQSIPVTGTATGTAPTITSANSTTFTVGTIGSFTVTASGNPTPTFSETGALPSGVTLSSAGALSGTPAAGAGGTYVINISASNGVGSPGTQSFTLTVHQAPAITSANSATFTVGTAGSFSATASGFPSPTFSETGALPSGVTLSSAGALSGTPAIGAGGTYVISISASNGVGTAATQSFTLTVDQAPAITSANSATFTVGTAGSFTATASGFPSPTFSETGALPSGVTLSSAGALSGIPAIGAGGTYVINISASNGVGTAATQTFTLTVDQSPAITSANSATFTVGAAGSFTATAPGFPSPTFSETGILPSGVTMSSSGVLSGTPAAGTGGTYPLTITASNGVGSPATQGFTLTVDQAPAVTSANNTTFTEGIPGSLTVTSMGYPGAAFSKTGSLPTGVTFVDQGNGTAILSGTPALGSHGTYPLAITASNGVSPDAMQSFTLTVNPPPSLVVNTAADDAGTASNCTPNPTTSGAGNCSLRDALAAAASLGGGNITFDTTVFAPTNSAAANTITLGSAGTMTIPSYISISGSLTGTRVTVDGANTYSIFATVASSVNVSIDGLTIANGLGGSGPFIGSGGGITNNGALTVANSTFSNDLAPNGYGGAIQSSSSSSTLTVTGSTFTGNTAQQGSAIYDGGASSISVQESTFSNNSAVQAGGAIYINNALTSVTDSTFANNSATVYGGAIMNYGTTSLANDIFAGNSAGDGGAVLNFGGSVTANYNLFYNNTESSGPDCDNCTSNLNAVTANPNLAPLVNYGGPTQTMLPLPGSAAICAGSLALVPNGVSTDQRGFGFLSTYCPSGSVDAGAVQTNYDIEFTQQPSTSTTESTIAAGQAITPAPAVSVTESGIGVSGATVGMTAAAGTLSGTTSQSSSGGTATFAGLSIAQEETNDTLSATLSLNPALAPPPSIVRTSYAFNLVNAAPALTTPSPGTALTCPDLSNCTVNFTWNPGLGSTQFLLTLGTTGHGSYNVYYGPAVPYTTTSVQVSHIPASGATIYARLHYYQNGAWLYVDGTYTEAGSPTPPAVTTPQPGTALSCTDLSNCTVNFTWTPGSGSTQFLFTLGTTGHGSSDVYNGQAIPYTTTTVQVSNIPANGQTLYARLHYYQNGAWSYVDSTYTEAGSPTPPALTTPQPATALSCTDLSNCTVNFTWDPGHGSSLFKFTLGTTGHGSSDVYSGAPVPSTTTSVQVSNIPAYGATLYARLDYYQNGTWSLIDYTYTEAGSPTPPALTTPQPETQLSCTDLSNCTVNFTWDPGHGSLFFRLTLGTTGRGSTNVYNGAAVPPTTTSALVTNIPTTGATIYARLRYYINGAWSYVDYTYTEP